MSVTPDAIAKSGSESAHQKALFAWAAIARHFGFDAAFDVRTYGKGGIPAGVAGPPIDELEWLHAIPNGGLREAVVAAKLKAEGVRRGIHDVCWPLPRSNRHGLYIEMKAGNGKPTPEQESFACFLLRQNYAVAVCYSWREAANVVQSYYDNHYAQYYVPNVFA